MNEEEQIVLTRERIRRAANTVLLGVGLWAVWLALTRAIAGLLY